MTLDHFIPVDRNEYAEMEREMDVKMTIRADMVDGTLFVAGNSETGHYVALELRNGYLSFR